MAGNWAAGSENGLMDAHLLDTNFVSTFFDTGSKMHGSAQTWMATASDDAFYLPSIALGELEFGVNLAIARGGGLDPTTRDLFAKVRRLPMVAPVTQETAEHYARVKSAIAITRFPKMLIRLGKKKLSKPDTWIDEVSGTKLGIDENDLWICAIALERNLNLVTFDTDMNYAKIACPDLRLTQLT